MRDDYDQVRERVQAATEDAAKWEERDARRQQFRDYRNHPVTKFFEDMRGGWRPSPTELDQLAKEVIDNTENPGMSFAELRRRLKTEADGITRLFAEGSNGDARTAAREAPDEIVGKLGEFIEPPSPQSQEMDPKKLADMVPRW